MVNLSQVNHKMISFIKWSKDCFGSLALNIDKISQKIELQMTFFLYQRQIDIAKKLVEENCYPGDCNKKERNSSHVVKH